MKSVSRRHAGGAQPAGRACVDVSLEDGRRPVIPNETVAAAAPRGIGTRQGAVWACCSGACCCCCWRCCWLHVHAYAAGARLAGIIRGSRAALAAATRRFARAGLSARRSCEPAASRAPPRAAPRACRSRGAPPSCSMAEHASSRPMAKIRTPSPARLRASSGSQHPRRAQHHPQDHLRRHRHQPLPRRQAHRSGKQWRLPQPH